MGEKVIKKYERAIDAILDLEEHEPATNLLPILRVLNDSKDHHKVCEVALMHSVKEIENQFS